MTKDRPGVAGMNKTEAPFVSNQLCVRGTVQGECQWSHNVYGEPFYRFFLESSRLSKTADCLPVLFSRRLYPQLVQPGQRLEIKGQLRSFNQQQAGRNHLVLSVFAKSLAETDLEDENKLTLQGYLCKPAVYRVTPFGREIADALLAVHRSYGKSDYIPCIFWGRNAGYVSKLAVGTPLFLQGRLQSRTYEKTLETGKEQRVAYEVSVSQVHLETEKNGAQD